MYENRTLAATGLGFTVLGFNLTLGWIVAGAFVIIVLGVVLLRLSTRHRRYQTPGQ
ncbi:hypothetical protein ACFS2C_09525 [Prauserella oleivorans]|uniref:LPXTG cell wall anchor domain-containing protein n=1 Tax=Prauserella oleivorans TaxID=1478153 RepID=A0ABW5W6S6_9PSEU